MCGGHPPRLSYPQGTLQSECPSLLPLPLPSPESLSPHFLVLGGVTVYLVLSPAYTSKRVLNVINFLKSGWRVTVNQEVSLPPEPQDTKSTFHSQRPEVPIENSSFLPALNKGRRELYPKSYSASYLSPDILVQTSQKSQNPISLHVNESYT